MSEKNVYRTIYKGIKCGNYFSMRVTRVRFAGRGIREIAKILRQTDVEKPLAVCGRRVSANNRETLYSVSWESLILLSIEYVMLMIWSILSRDVSIKFNVSSAYRVRKGKEFYWKGSFQSSACRCLGRSETEGSPWLSSRIACCNYIRMKNFVVDMRE